MYDIYHWEAHPNSTYPQCDLPERVSHYEAYLEKYDFITCPGLIDKGFYRDCEISTKWKASYTTIVTVDIEGIIQYRKDFPSDFNNAYSGLDTKIAELLADVDTTSPTVTVQSPGSNDLLDQGTQADIKWTAHDNINVVSRAIYFSADDGANWSLIDSASGNTGTFSWTVPSTNSSLCLVEIRAYDKMGNDGIGQSGSFSISGTGIINAFSRTAKEISFNTVNGDMHLTIPVQADHTFQIFDLAGRNIYTKQQSRSQQYNLSKLVPAGPYIISLATRDSKYIKAIVISE